MGKREWLRPFKVITNMDKDEVSRILEEIGHILEIRGENPFKVRAYENAARVIGSVPTDIAELVKSGKLPEIKGIGKSLSEHITDLIKKGKVDHFEEIKKSVPTGLLEMLHIAGMGPKKVKAVWEELGVTTVGELEYACNENRLVDLPGFGEKTQEKILQGIENLKKYQGQFLLAEAIVYARPLIEAIKKSKDVIRASVAGSLRRRKEIVKDIDIVAATDNSKPVMDLFTRLPQVDSVTAKGSTKSSVVLRSGIAADLRTVSDAEYPFALHHFTGSKEHNTQMRGRAKKQGIKMNEYGLFRGTKSLRCKDEEEIFRKLGLAYIPPELREAMGEIEQAEKGPFHRLLEQKDMKGMFHVHSDYSDGRATIEEMARATRDLGYKYLGLSDHSRSASYAGGLSIEEVRKQHKQIDRINSKLKDFYIFKGIESDILPDGSLDYPKEVLKSFDFIIVSIHSRFGLPEKEQTKRIIKAIENPYTTVLGHPTGRLLLAREAYQVNLKEVLKAAKDNNVVIELNSNPHRLDLDWRWCRTAREMGVKIVIGPDAHGIDGLSDVEFGVDIARKGWLGPENVINTLDRKAFEKFLKGVRG